MTTTHTVSTLLAAPASKLPSRTMPCSGAPAWARSLDRQPPTPPPHCRAAEPDGFISLASNKAPHLFECEAARKEVDERGLHALAAPLVGDQDDGALV